ncbi:alpha/beta fold hydrolase [Sphingosinicellaceae bacterium]|nr:alpha/beta fold hydrolase [Sphingosinicellaceae bacterium]
MIISLLLLPIVIAPVALRLAQVMWIVGAALMLGFAWLVIDRWMGSRQQVAHSTPAWIVPVVGLLDVPLALSGLVGHSYGGEVIAVAASGAANVKGLVFVAGLAPEPGESAASLGARFPTGTLGQALAPPVVQASGDKDLYIDPAKYWQQFAADVPEPAAMQMAATQRPVTEAALNEAAGETAWKTTPSWFIYGSLDRNIPAALHAFMAKRAGAKQTVEIKGASHVVMISQPNDVAKNDRACCGRIVQCQSEKNCCARGACRLTISVPATRRIRMRPISRSGYDGTTTTHAMGPRLARCRITGT